MALVLVFLGLGAMVLTIIVVRAVSTRPFGRAGPARLESPVSMALPERRAPLVTRLAVVLLEDLGDEVFTEPAVMATLRDCAERGASGSFVPESLDWRLGADGGDFPGLLETAGIPAAYHGGVAFHSGVPRLPTRDRESAFDEELFARLDTGPWAVLIAGLEPETPIARTSPLYLEGTRQPTEACFALSALDHEGRRLLLRLGSHLTLLVIRRGDSRADWTLSGPGSDDAAVQAAMKEGAVARALALLLGFAID